MATTNLRIVMSADAAGAQRALKDVAGQFGAVDQAARGLGRSMGGATADTSNLVAQFQDIGVTLASGASPLLIAIQQGSQISQVLGPMGARGAVQALGAAFVGLINPVTFITIGAIAGGATLLQWLTSTDDSAKDLTGTVSDLEAAMKRVQDANANYSLEGLEALRGKYGEITAELVEMLERQREFGNAEQMRTALAAMDRVRGEIDGWFSSESTDISDWLGLGEKFNYDMNLIAMRVNAVKDAFTQMEGAETYEDQIAAVRLLLALLEGTEAETSELYGTLLNTEGALRQIVQESESLPTLLQDATDGASGVRAELSGAADEAERIVAALNSMPDPRRESIDTMTGIQAGGRDRLNAASGEGILSLIRQVEGTAGPNGYNTSLGNGRFLPGGREVDLTNKTLAEILELQRAMLANPANTFNSSALGAYQIVGTTLGGEGLTGQGGLIKALGLSLDEQFTPELQDRLAQELIRQRSGQGLAGFQNEWEGIRDQGVSEAQLNRALGASPVPAVDPAVAAEAERQAQLSAQAREAEARAVEAAQRAYDGLRGSLDPLAAAQNALTAGQATLKDAFDRGLISVQEYDAGLAALQQRFNEQSIDATLDQILQGSDELVEAQLRVQAAADAGANSMATLFGSIIDGSKSAKEALGDLLAQLAQVQIQRAFLDLSGMNGGNNLFADLGNALNVGGGGVPAPSIPSSIARMAPAQMPSFETAAARVAERGAAGGGGSEMIVRMEPGVTMEIVRGTVRQEREVDRSQFAGRVKQVQADPRGTRVR